MKTRFRILLALVLLMVSGFVHAAGATAQQAKQLLELSGMGQQIDQIPMMIDRALAQQQAQLQMPDWQLSALSASLHAGFDPTAMKQEVLVSLAGGLSKGDAAAAIDWLESDAGRAVTEMEAQSGTPVVQQEMMRILQNGGDAGITQEQADLIGRLDSATRASEMSTEMVMALQRGMLTAVLKAAGAPDEQLNMMLQQIEAGRAVPVGRVQPFQVLLESLPVCIGSCRRLAPVLQRPVEVDQVALHGAPHELLAQEEPLIRILVKYSIFGSVYAPFGHPHPMVHALHARGAVYLALARPRCTLGLRKHAVETPMSIATPHAGSGLWSGITGEGQVGRP